MNAAATGSDGSPARWWRFPAAAGLLIALYYVFLPTVALRLVASGVVLIVAPSLIVWGVARFHPERPRAWYLLSGAVVLAGAGDLTRGISAWPSGVDHLSPLAAAFYIGAYVLEVGAVTDMTTARWGRQSQMDLVDGLVVAVAVALASWKLLVAPHASAGGLGDDAAFVSMLVPTMSVTLVWIVWRFLTRPRPGPFAGRVVLVAFALLAIGAIAALAVSEGLTESASLWFIGVFPFADLLLCVAALHPSMRAMTVAPGERRRRSVLGRVVTFGAASSVGIAAMISAARSGQPAAVIGGAVLVLLVVVRLAMALYATDDELRRRVRIETRFRSVLESLEEGVLVQDDQGRILEANAAAARITGVNVDELKSSARAPEWRAVTPNGGPLPGELRPGRTALQTGEAQIGVELGMARPDGTLRWIELNAIPMVMPTGESDPVVVSSFRDITERLNAERVRAELAAIVESSTEAIISRALDGRITSWNPAAEQLYGYTASEATGGSIPTLIPAERQSEGEQLFTKIGSGVAIPSFDTQRLHKNGNLIDVSVSMSPIWDAHGYRIGSASIHVDITERTRLAALAEENRRRLVEAEAVAREQSLRRSAAEHASAAKNEFLSRMSHELRTPLNAVLGFGQLLALSGLSSSDAEHVDRIVEGGRHLLALINEVLDIAHIESGHLTMHVEPIAAADAVRQATNLIAPVAASRRIDVRFAPPDHDLWVTADRKRLQQIMLNLLSNAVKYNTLGGRIDIAVSAPSADKVEIAVTDTGPGIAADQLERVFEPFERIGAEQTDVEGTGVGLTVVRALVEAMHGDIVAESVLGVGSTFRVQLPLACSAGQPAGILEGHADDEPGAEPLIEVLYIEDNQANRVLMKHILSTRPNVHLRTANDGGSGLDLVGTNRPDLVLLDVHLPDMDGPEVLERLRSDAATRDIPVVAVTAGAGSDTRHQLKVLGLDHFLTKPFDLAELFAIIDDVATRAPIG
jgi:PAS domain S-box-containing protein